MSQNNSVNKQSALTQPKGNKQQAQRRPQHAQRGHVQSQIESKLANLFNLNTQRSRGGLADLKSIGQDGQDHINVHRVSKNKLGFLLSTAALHDFTLFGKRFTSIDNMTIFYRSHCTVDSLATGPVGQIRDFSANSVKSYPPITNLYVLVCLAYVEIFKKLPDLLEAMRMNNLPLDSYYFPQKNVRQRHPASATLVSAIQEAFQAVRDNRDADLTKFMFQEKSRSIQTRSTLEGKTFLEIVRAEFAPKAIREDFYEKHADLAKELKDAEVARRAERKAQRDAAAAEAAKPTPVPDVVIELDNVMQGAPMHMPLAPELQDAPTQANVEEIPVGVIVDDAPVEETDKPAEQ